MSRHSVLSTTSYRHHAHEFAETNDFWKIKIKFYFNEILDCNDDGKITAEDIKIIAEFYKDIKKLDEKSSKLINFVNFLEKWKSNLLNFIGKDSVNIDDFIKYCEKLRSHLIRYKEWPSDMRNYIDALFTMLDDDNDGYITLKDFLSISINDDDTKCREQSWKLIKNHAATHSSSYEYNYKMSKEAFDKYSREFITSTDTKTVGNWIFGTFDYRNYEKNKEIERQHKAQLAKEAEKMMDKVQREKEKAGISGQSEKSHDKAGNKKLNEIEKNALR